MEDKGLEGRIVLKWIFKKLEDGIDWIDVAQDSDKWRALVHAVMNSLFPRNKGNFFN
jgi:hypothetical protein